MPPLRADQSVAVIGAGVAGCAVVAQLRRLGWSGAIELWEMGRGPGGRAATRRSRQDRGLRINHGAPLLSLEPGRPAPQLLEPLLAGGWLEPFRSRVAWLDSKGLRLEPGSDPLQQGQLYGAPAGMDQLGQGLLQLAAAGSVAAAATHFHCLVRHLQARPGGGWRLFGGDRQPLAEADWLLVSGSLIAHPRCRTLLGWPEPPLQAAAADLDDPRLEAALQAIAAIRYEASSNLLLELPAERAAAWLALPFRLLSVAESLQQRWPLRRVSIQPLDDGRCAVVAHSSVGFAAGHLGVVGSGSAAARLAGSGDASAEAAVIAALGEALTQLMTPWIGSEALAISADRAQLMRWGAALPVAGGLPAHLSLCPASRIGFCGDLVAGPGYGRIEGALRSAEALAANLVQP